MNASVTKISFRFVAQNGSYPISRLIAMNDENLQGALKSAYDDAIDAAIEAENPIVYLIGANIHSGSVATKGGLAGLERLLNQHDVNLDFVTVTMTEKKDIGKPEEPKLFWGRNLDAQPT